VPPEQQPFVLLVFSAVKSVSEQQAEGATVASDAGFAKQPQPFASDRD
jgi:hypothetical protein